jgi:hypothetical protein
LVFEKAISRFLESCAVFWVEFLPMVFFPQVAGGIACTGLAAEDAKGFERILPIRGYPRSFDQFPQFAGGIACTGIIAEDAKGFRRLLPIRGC